MLVGRKEERKQLEEIYSSDRNNLLILYGRIGIGKTALVNSFVENRKVVYYTGRECTEREQKLRILEEFESAPDTLDASFNPNYYDIFNGLLEETFKDTDEKQLLILDEFHHLTLGSSDFIDALLKLTSETEKRRMIILMSSSINWIEQSMVSVLGTVARRITGFMKLKPLTFAEMVEWFPSLSVGDCIVVNAVLGGIPRYLTCWKEKQTAMQNITELILTQNGRLYDEAEYVLKTELRELAAYNSILYAMASGKNKLNDIYHHTGFSRAKISVYIKNLIQMDIVEKLFSFDTKDKTEVQKGLYRIKDNFIHFWYRFVFPHKSKIEIGKSELIYSKSFEENMNTYIQYYFSEVCCEYLKLMNQYDRLGNKYDDFGSWYGKKGRLDAIMQDKNKNALAAMCIWEEQPCGAEKLKLAHELCEAAALKTKEIYLFSRNDFTDELRQVEKEDDNLHLVPLSNL